VATIRINDTIELDETELRYEFMRGAGPGGQNVNKVETAVQLRFDAANSAALPADVRERLVALAGNRLTEAGEIVITARTARTQPENRARALAALVGLIERASIPPVPRHKTKPTAASRARRLDTKKRRGETKRMRRQGWEA
jgi:ribosome-associated protein